MTVIDTINSLEATFVKNVSNELHKLYGKIDDYEIAWRQLQQVSTEAIVKVLEKKFPDATIIVPTSKSVYPDIKIEIEGKVYAIDIKANESSKQPWFDMARLDTIEKERLEKYEEEWELVIKYDSATKQFEKAYFMLFRHAVGIRQECKGLKYRPYDGKVRPKSWEDFENGVVYWKTKRAFKKGIKNSIKHRWKSNIEQYLIPKLSKKEKEIFKKLFE